MAEIRENDIIVGHFGYEADIAVFYRVLKRTPSQVQLVELEEQRWGGFMDWECVPKDREVGKPFRRKVKDYGNGEYVSISSYEIARLWDGKPVSCYNYH